MARELNTPLSHKLLVGRTISFVLNKERATNWSPGRYHRFRAPAVQGNVLRDRHGNGLDISDDYAVAHLSTTTTITASSRVAGISQQRAVSSSLTPPARQVHVCCDFHHCRSTWCCPGRRGAGLTRSRAATTRGACSTAPRWGITSQCPPHFLYEGTSLTYQWHFITAR